MEEDIPPESFFTALEAQLKERFPKACAELREHLVSVERLCWHACAFGLSFKAVKAQLAQALARMLGEYVGRGRRLKDPEKAKAISCFAPPTSLKQLQEFLGMFNYVRPGCRGSAGRHLHFLRPWLRGEKFP